MHGYHVRFSFLSNLLWPWLQLHIHCICKFPIYGKLTLYSRSIRKVYIVIFPGFCVGPRVSHIKYCNLYGWDRQTQRYIKNIVPVVRLGWLAPARQNIHGICGQMRECTGSLRKSGKTNVLRSNSRLLPTLRGISGTP